MCFEFEWLYWAQMAQEEEQRRKEAAQQADAQSGRLHGGETAVVAEAQRPEQRKPLHA